MHVVTHPGLEVKKQAHDLHDLSPRACCVLGLKFSQTAIDDQVEIIIAEEAPFSALISH